MVGPYGAFTVMTNAHHLQLSLNVVLMGTVGSSRAKQTHQPFEGNMAGEEGQTLAIALLGTTYLEMEKRSVVRKEQ